MKAKYTFDFSEEEEEEEDGDEEQENDASASPVRSYKDTEQHNDDEDDDDDIFPPKTTFTALYVLSIYSLLGESLKAWQKHFKFIFQKYMFCINVALLGPYRFLHCDIILLQFNTFLISVMQKIAA